MWQALFATIIERLAVGIIKRIALGTVTANAGSPRLQACDRADQTMQGPQPTLGTTNHQEAFHAFQDGTPINTDCDPFLGGEVPPSAPSKPRAA